MTRKHPACWHALEGTAIPQGSEHICIWLGLYIPWCLCVARAVGFLNVSSAFVFHHTTLLLTKEPQMNWHWVPLLLYLEYESLCCLPLQKLMNGAHELTLSVMPNSEPLRRQQVGILVICFTPLPGYQTPQWMKQRKMGACHYKVYFCPSDHGMGTPLFLMFDTSQSLSSLSVQLGLHIPKSTG